MTAPLDPIATVAEFAGRVAPYDPAPDAPPAALIGVRTGTGEAVFELSDHILRAMCRALDAYRDPQDRGTCGECGGRRLDDDLRCVACGRVHGILGEVLAQHAGRAARDA
ncbi:hypothetical protein [Actinoplanes sp. N902-109]|uniref:hypothetical protein n=1 Tax=Actinoplanes sp. (strain N902-109) TaxID=649831 RepID=UPI00032959AC|nr:hypothetical protein [Actinoplanes sp. N902-109]AGL14349.1 hypothetical protein L083_0839 [Actinoplanes sp. N902-109]